MGRKLTIRAGALNDQQLVMMQSHQTLHAQLQQLDVYIKEKINDIEAKVAAMPAGGTGGGGLGSRPPLLVVVQSLPVATAPRGLPVFLHLTDHPTNLPWPAPGRRSSTAVSLAPSSNAC